MRKSKVRIAAATAIAAAAGVVVFLAGLVGAAPAFGGGTQGLVMVSLAALFIFLLAFIIVLITPPLSDARIDDTSKSEENGNSARPPARGLFNELAFRRQLREVRLKGLSDLEGEVNLRIANVHTDENLGGALKAELTFMLGDLPRWRRKNPIDRAMIVSSFERAHGLEDPLDPHTFLMDRYEAREKEIYRRFGFHVESEGLHPPERKLGKRRRVE
jgi:hypothetical protein